MSSPAAAEFAEVFAELKSVLATFAKKLSVKTDSPSEYTVVTRSASPFPQHKGQPMFFGSVRLGKAYVSYHLMPVYMNPVLTGTISPALKKRMQGKSCFNFKTSPGAELISELTHLTKAGLDQWGVKKWL